MIIKKIGILSARRGEARRGCVSTYPNNNSSSGGEAAADRTACSALLRISVGEARGCKKRAWHPWRLIKLSCASKLAACGSLYPIRNFLGDARYLCCRIHSSFRGHLELGDKKMPAAPIFRVYTYTLSHSIANNSFTSKVRGF